MRAGDQFEVNFHNVRLPHTDVVTPTVQKIKGYKRLMSGQECLRLQYGKKYKRMSASPVIGSRKKSAMDDEFFVTGGEKKKLYCWLCREAGCTRWTCHILCAYANTPGNILRKGDQQSRDRLCDAITSYKNKILIHKRYKKDKRTIFKDMPQRVKALIVQKRLERIKVYLTQLLKGILV